MISFTLVVFPIERASAWAWIAGENSPSLSSDGSLPASHRWFSIQPTAEELSRIDSTLIGTETKLEVDLDSQSPRNQITSETGLVPIEAPNEE